MIVHVLCHQDSQGLIALCIMKYVRISEGIVILTSIFSVHVCLICSVMHTSFLHYLTFKSLVLIVFTTRFKPNNSTFCPHSVFMCFLWISEQTAIISMYSFN